MIMPDNINDETLEYAAQRIEAMSFLDIAGTMAKRKRDREDAELRYRVRQELRAELAKDIRAMKARPDLNATAVLARLAARQDDAPHIGSLVDAWPLAWKGWLNITATIRCNSNQIPPQTEYRITLTDRGKSVLAEAAQ